MRRMKKKKGREHRKVHHKRAMTIAYSSGPEMAGKWSYALETAIRVDPCGEGVSLLL